MANKIKFGLKNVYYAKATIATDGSATYSTPVSFPGAVSLSLSPQGDTSNFYADNVVYWVGVSNQGYEGDLEIARVSDDFKKDILGYIVDGGGALVEDVNAPAQHFALMFQFEGDEKATRHVMYNCVAQRPDTAGSTKEEGVDPQTESVSITATSIFSSALNTDIVKAEMAEATNTPYSTWFTSVYTVTTATP